MKLESCWGLIKQEAEMCSVWRCAALLSQRDPPKMLPGAIVLLPSLWAEGIPGALLWPPWKCWVLGVCHVALQRALLSLQHWGTAAAAFRNISYQRDRLQGLLVVICGELMCEFFKGALVFPKGRPFWRCGCPGDHLAFFPLQVSSYRGFRTELEFDWTAASLLLLRSATCRAEGDEWEGAFYRE